MALHIFRFIPFSIPFRFPFRVLETPLFYAGLNFMFGKIPQLHMHNAKSYLKQNSWGKKWQNDWWKHLRNVLIGVLLMNKSDKELEWCSKNNSFFPN